MNKIENEIISRDTRGRAIAKCVAPLTLLASAGEVAAASTVSAHFCLL